MPNGSALWELAVACRPTHPKTAFYNSQGVKTFYFFTKHHMNQHARPFGDLHKVRGPGTKLQQTERRGRVSEDSLGWREEAMARDGPGTDKGSKAWLARRG